MKKIINIIQFIFEIPESALICIAFILCFGKKYFTMAKHLDNVNDIFFGKLTVDLVSDYKKIKLPKIIYVAFNIATWIHFLI